MLLWANVPVSSNVRIDLPAQLAGGSQPSFCLSLVSLGSFSTRSRRPSRAARYRANIDRRPVDVVRSSPAEFTWYYADLSALRVILFALVRTLTNLDHKQLKSMLLIVFVVIIRIFFWISSKKNHVATTLIKLSQKVGLGYTEYSNGQHWLAVWYEMLRILTLMLHVRGKKAQHGYCIIKKFLDRS